MTAIVVDADRQEQFRLAVMAIVERVPPFRLETPFPDEVAIGAVVAALWFANLTLGDIRRFFELANHPTIKRLSP